MATETTVVPAVPKVSWLKHFGHILGRILGFVAKEAKPIADTASEVASVLFPQFGPLIAAGDALVTKIAQQAIVAEALASKAGTASGTGAQKLETVLANLGPSIDQWVMNAFPGSKGVSAVAKSGLISAVVGIINEVSNTVPVGVTAPIVTTAPVAKAA